ncbi:protein LTV1 homolog [Culicoides brevitarsis]|uniref:protein LTV1 homolog n=1 Tax=Culicoides brevitarsis TaxID=469753 RepID=UPI00307B7306
MGKKKKFIDKKKAVTFHLVHRSQQDPLICDENAPQHVLVPADGATPGPSTSKSQNKLDPAKRKEEQKKFGIFFDDDYDYLQHLRDVGQQVVSWEPVEPRQKNKSGEEPKAAKIQLPSSVFASEFEEDEGLLRRAIPVKGPRPDWDPDVVAALDEDFNFDDPENQLEDNFMELAMQEGEEYDEDDEKNWSDYDSNAADESGNEYDDEEYDDLGPLRGFGNEETKSRFTEYSMSSSVIRRNEQLTLLDDKFEKFYEQYDDMEVGALDCDEIEGTMDPNDEMLLRFATEFKKEHKSIPYEKSYDICRMVKMQMKDESSEEEMVELEVSDDEEKKWDCQSILSTYSNLYNHPKLIQEPSKRKKKIEIDPKTGVPKNVFSENTSKLTAKALSKLNTNSSEPSSSQAGPKSLCAQSVISTLSVLSIRPKDETPEEKKERKKLLKDYRAERRIERKANTLAFKEEKRRQDQIKANNRNNIQGNRIL